MANVKSSYTETLRESIKTLNSVSDLIMLSALVSEINDDARISSELSVLLGPEAFLKLVKYFGGTTITVPTKTELLESVELIRYYYYNKVLGYSYRKTMNTVGKTPKGSASTKLRAQLDELEGMITSRKVAKLSNSNDELPNVKGSIPINVNGKYYSKEDYDNIRASVLEELGISDGND